MSNWSPTIDRDASPLFREIVRVLSADIAQGRLACGHRLPTHRELADELGVARGTVARAYAEAERCSLIRSEVGRGSFVAAGSASSTPLLAFGFSDSSLIDLSVNFPLYEEDPDLKSGLKSLARESGLQELLQYQPESGMPRHRAAGAAWLARCGLRVDASEVLLCAGAQNALMIACASVARPDDMIVTEKLTYPGIRAVAQSLHLRLHGVRIDEFGIVPEEFEAVCCKQPVRALYSVPTIQNPTCSVLPLGRRREIVEIAKKHRVAILEDDIHRVQEKNPPPTLRSLLPEQVYYISSLSKLVAGLRVAFLLPPYDNLEKTAHQVLATNWMVSPITAAIASLWIEDGTLDRAIERKNVEIARRQEIVEEVLGSYVLARRPCGLSAWLELSADRASAAFAVEARRRGVAVTPAEVFAVGTGPAPNGVRICLGAVRGAERLREGLVLLEKLLRSGANSGMGIV